MPTSFRNGLHVVEDAVDFNAVDKALYDVDSHLFLSWEVQDGQKCYRVLFDRGDDPPATIAFWKNERGDPLPLSHGLVDLVKSLRPRDGKIDFEATIRANQELEEKRTLEFEEEVDAIADEGVRWMMGRRKHTWLGASRGRARDRSRYRRMGIED